MLEPSEDAEKLHTGPDSAADTDTGADPHADTSADTSVDTGSDTGVDTSVDTGSDTGADTSDDTGADIAVDAVALAGRASDLAALATGACGALIDPWALSEPDDAMRAWALVLDESWDLLSEELSAHADGVCPNRPDTWSSEGDCTTSDGWTFVGSHDWSASSRGSSYEIFSGWGLAHADADASYEALAVGRAEQSVDPPEGDEPVRYGHGFEDFRQRAAHSGSYNEGNNGTWIREGAFFSSVLDWPVSGEVYLQIAESDTLPTGDLCVGYALEEVEACPEEPTGTFTLVGAQDVTVHFDGEVMCDGCGTITLDGVDVGEVCLGS